MRIAIAVMLLTVHLRTDDRLGTCSCFADLDPSIPRVAKSFVTSTSTVSEPGATATATTHFAGFLDDTTFGANETDVRCRELARLHAFNPAATNISVAATSALLVPRTARSATTSSAGFCKRAALWALYR